MPEQGTNGEVIITTVDIWNKLLDIESVMGKRISSLERYRWLTAGGGVIIGGALTIFGGYLTNYVLR